MLNECQFIGNLGSAPEVRTMQSGDEVANLSIAVTERWKDKNTGEKRESTEWVRCVVFSKGLVGICKQYLNKGSKVYIKGKLQTRSWEKDGEKKYATEIVLQGFDSKLVMLDSRSSDGSEHPTSNGEVAGSSPAASTIDDMGDEIPF